MPAADDERDLVCVVSFATGRVVYIPPSPQEDPMIPTITRMVCVLGVHSNGAEVQPATITRVWSNERSTLDGAIAVNLMVFPDAGAPEARSSVLLFHTEEQARAHRAASNGKCGPMAFWPPRVPA